MEPHVIAMPILVVFVAIMLNIYHTKLLDLKTQCYEHAFCLPYARTLARVLESTPDDALPAQLRTLEDSQFRSVNVSVFSVHGEVWMDSLQPSMGKYPLPPSEWQTSTFRAIYPEVLKEPRGARVNLFRPCSPVSSAYDTTFVSGVLIESKQLVVVVVQCGTE